MTGTEPFATAWVLLGLGILLGLSALSSRLAGKSGLPIVVTDVQPGFVDTAMMKPERPLGTIARSLLVVSPAVAARQILKAVQRRAKHVYVPERYRLIAFVAKFLPRPG